MEVSQLFYVCTLPTDLLFNLEFKFESIFNLELQPKFGIQLEISIPMGIYLGECGKRRENENILIRQYLPCHQECFIAFGSFLMTPAEAHTLS